MIRTLQAVVLDFDGVIADSEPLHLKAFQQTLEEEHIVLTAEEYYTRYLGYDDVGMFRALASDRGLTMSGRAIAALVARKSVKLQEMLHSDGVMFPGAVAFIRSASAAVPLGIASGALRHEIMEILQGASIDHLFKVVVAAGDTPQGKPSPEPYLLACERLRQQSGWDLDPGRCVAIEDSRWGLESARRAGLRCVGVTTSYPAEELTGAELIVSGLDQLTLAALDRLFEA